MLKDMIAEVYKIEKEADILRFWLAKYPLMVQGYLEYEVFEKFKESIDVKTYTNKSLKEIETEIETIVKAYEERVM